MPVAHNGNGGLEDALRRRRASGRVWVFERVFERDVREGGSQYYRCREDAHSISRTREDTRNISLSGEEGMSAGDRFSRFLNKFQFSLAHVQLEEEDAQRGN